VVGVRRHGVTVAHIRKDVRISLRGMSGSTGVDPDVLSM
jgi:hypothetical protein